MDYIAIITAILGAAIGYLARYNTMRLAHERATHINERDLLARIDHLQDQIVELTRENASLKSEVAGLRDDIRAYRARMLEFDGADYAEGDV